MSLRFHSLRNAYRCPYGCHLANNAEALCLILDEKGDTESIVPLKVAAHNMEKDMTLLVFVAPARSGRVVCRIALCNMETGYGVRGSQTITIPQARDATLWLDPPLILANRSVEEICAPPQASLANIYAYDAIEYSPLFEDLPAGTKIIRAALRVTSLRPNFEIELTAQLMEAGGTNTRPIPVAIVKDSTDGPIKKLLVDLELGELKSGRYTLSLTAREKGGLAVAQTTREITIK